MADEAIPDELSTALREQVTDSLVEYVAVHTMYLLNLASPDDSLYSRSVAALEEEIARASILGVDNVVTHIGAHVDSGLGQGIRRVAAALDRLIGSPQFVKAARVRLLLENTAGSGSTVGATFDELGTILASLSDDGRIGVCLDTCRAYAAGYDLRTRWAIDGTLATLDRDVGLDRLALVHLNGSKYSLGGIVTSTSGKGTLGGRGWPKLSIIPFCGDFRSFLRRRTRSMAGPMQTR